MAYGRTVRIYRGADKQNLLQQWCEVRVEEGPWDQRRTIETSLGATHVAATGSGDQTVLWLPGTNFNAATSATLAGHLQDHFRFCVADLPGQPGLSSPNSVGRGRVRKYGAWANEVVGHLTDFGAGDGVLVAGHSLGGAVALAADPAPSGKGPGIRGIALFSPAGLSRIRITGSLLSTSIRWQVRPSRDSSESLLRYMQAPGSALDPELVEWMELVGRHTWQPGAPGPQPESQVGRWRGRASVVTGSVDPFFPPTKLQKTATTALDAHVRVVEEAGHLLPDERPDAVLDALRDLATALA